MELFESKKCCANPKYFHYLCGKCRAPVCSGCMYSCGKCLKLVCKNCVAAIWKIEYRPEISTCALCYGNKGSRSCLY